VLKKLVFSAVLALSFGMAWAAPTQLFSTCLTEFPAKKVPVAKEPGRDLCFDSFAVLYSPVTKKPIYTVERLSAARLESSSNMHRSDRFYEEARLPRNERSTLEDYKGSGFDRGHNAPAADMPNQNAMAQSFSLANMMPQDPENNRGVWAKSVEKTTRQYVKRASGDVFVFTGSTGQSVTIGANHVVVPTHLFKLVYDATTRRSWVFWVENTVNAKVKLISVAELGSRVGIDFNLP